MNISLLDRPLHAPAALSAQGIRRGLMLTGTLALVSLAILLPVVQSSDETAQGYRIRQLELQKADVEAQIYQTQSQIAQLGALSRIDGDARTRLGMIAVQREVAISVPVPMPSSDSVPTSYLPQAPGGRPAPGESFWQQLRHLLPFS
jgi:hypothetical protein